jgi:hypothetical protein
VARLFADENFPLPVVEELRVLGHDVVTIQEAGMAERGISDPDVLTTFRWPTIATMAAANGRRQPRKTREDTKKKRRMSFETSEPCGPFRGLSCFSWFRLLPEILRRSPGDRMTWGSGEDRPPVDRRLRFFGRGTSPSPTPAIAARPQVPLGADRPNPPSRRGPDDPCGQLERPGVTLATRGR